MEFKVTAKQEILAIDHEIMRVLAKRPKVTSTAELEASVEKEELLQGIRRKVAERLQTNPSA